jgi:hypothetical protein
MVVVNERMAQRIEVLYIWIAIANEISGGEGGAYRW